MCGFSVTMTAMRGGGVGWRSKGGGGARGGGQGATDVACARAKNPEGTPRPVYAHAPVAGPRTNPAREYSPRPTPPRRWFPPLVERPPRNPDPGRSSMGVRRRRCPGVGARIVPNRYEFWAKTSQRTRNPMFGPRNKRR